MQLRGRELAEAPAALDACRGLVVESARAGAEVVVLPEGAYPAYVLGSAEAGRVALAAGPDPLEAFGAMARAGAVTLVAGIVTEDGGGGLHNSAVAFGPDGAEIGRTAKRFLWDFDARWFTPGVDSPVWDTPVGRVGALVCADARLPEIPRLLAVRGAALICDPTAWVRTSPGPPGNIQPDFLIAARAIENGVVVAAASKTGGEGGTEYVGRSMIVGPDGTVLAQAGGGPDDEEIAVADVDLGGLPRPAVERKGPMYRRLAMHGFEKSLPPTAARAKVVVAGSPAAADPDALIAASEQGATLAVVPPGSGPAPGLALAADLWVVTAAAAPADPRSDAGVVATNQGDVVARFATAHGPSATALALSPPISTPAGRVTVLLGDDVYPPEQSRLAALRGAEILVVMGSRAPLAVLRARAAENRVFVVATAGTTGTVVIDPAGSVIADAPAGSPFLLAAELDLLAAAEKEMAPGTDVFAGRTPGLYRDLVT